MNLSAAVGRMWRSMPPGVRDLYYRMPLPIRRLINRGVFDDEPKVLEVQTGLMRGMKMRLSPRTESGFYLGTHEPELQESLAPFIKPGLTVFDVGANIGFFAIATGNLVGATGKVVAFEPNPNVCVRLKENLELNGLGVRVIIEQCAVGDFDGTAEFCFALTHQQGRFSDLPYVPKGAQTIPVPCRKIDSYVASTELIPDVLIIDVEHAEGRALRGMKSVLQRYKPLIFIEMHGPEAIREAFGEIVNAEYKLFKLPTLAPVDKIEDIALLGHFLARPSESAKVVPESAA
jgi:FkbM family methyltransferase